jgi:DNA-binding beta-propeller fold protein YncE
MRKGIVVLCTLVLFACKKTETVPSLDETVNEDLSTYTEIASLNLGGLGAAEITTYDALTQRLFAVNNGTVNKIDVIDMSNPASIKVLQSISMAPYGGYVNSVDVNNGFLAAAIESTNKQAAGKVVVFNTSTLAVVKEVTVGSLPDMVVFSPNGRYILTANEGEPNDAYTVDPEGTVSIIDVQNNYSVKTINFSAFSSQAAALAAKGFRIFGPGKNFLNDIEPEYITVSEDSKTAYITLQENNGIAELDIETGSFTKITPLGFKDYSLAINATDMSDRDNAVGVFNTWKAFGMYMPDAIANMNYNGTRYLFTANEGDSREYAGFSEMKRVSALTLDATAFPTGATLKTDAQLGRLNVTTTLGDTDNDGDYDAFYSLGARSFSIWNASTGVQVFDSKNELDVKAKELGVYDDGRSDDKSVEPEAITIGRVGSKMVAYVGMERVDAVAVYDVTDPTKPSFIKMFKTGDAPEGVLFISASKSPIQQSLIVVSSENDGLIKIFKANKL